VLNAPCEVSSTGPGSRRTIPAAPTRSANGHTSPGALLTARSTKTRHLPTKLESIPLLWTLLTSTSESFSSWQTVRG
jgi:hypothetical protein